MVLSSEDWVMFTWELFVSKKIRKNYFLVMVRVGSLFNICVIKWRIGPNHQIILFYLWTIILLWSLGLADYRWPLFREINTLTYKMKILMKFCCCGLLFIEIFHRILYKQKNHLPQYINGRRFFYFSNEIHIYVFVFLI